jgi:hypothetical protein
VITDREIPGTEIAILASWCMKAVLVRFLERQCVHLVEAIGLRQ